MKFIPKYYVGGVSVVTPMLPSVAQAVEQAQTAAAKSSNSESESGSKKSYIEQIFDPKAKMLASDAIAMSQLASSVGNFEATPAFQNMSKSQQFAAVYGQYITRARMAESNYESLMDAKKHITSNESSGEVALTSEGYMFVHKDGDREVSLIHPTEFNKKSDIPVTNAELLYLRANDPRFAFNDKASSSLLSATSMKDIREIIMDVTKDLGSISSEPEHYINPHSPNTEQALKELAQANITQADITNMDVGTLLKVKTKNKSNAEAIKYALRVIESQLNTQQRALLQLRAKEIGGKATPESLIVEYLSSMLNVESSFSLDIITTKTASGENKSKSKTTEPEDPLKNLDMPPVVQWMSGRGEILTHRISNGSRGSLIVPGNSMAVMRGDTPQGLINLKELANTSFAGALYLDQATVGGVQIKLQKQHHVLVNGNNIVNMPLPVDQAALAQNIIRPDFEAMDRFNNAWKELHAMGIDGSNPADINKINQKLQEYGLPAVFVGVQNGVPVINLTHYRRFGVLNGFVDGAVLGDDAQFNSALTPVRGNEAEALLKEFKEKQKGYKGNYIGGVPILGWFSDPDLYEAAIFIPIRQDYISAYAGSGTNVNVRESDDLQRRQYDTEHRRENPTQDRYTPNSINIQGY